MHITHLKFETILEHLNVSIFLPIYSFSYLELVCHIQIPLKHFNVCGRNVKNINKKNNV